MLLIQTIVLFTVLACLFINFRLGLAMYISYFLLVPFPSVECFGVTFSNLVINAILLIAYTTKYRLWFDFSIIKPLLVLYLLWFMETIFQNNMPFLIQYRYFYEDILQIFVLPTIVVSAVRFEPNVLKYCVISVIASYVAIIIYNIVLFFIPDVNPYIIMMSLEHNVNIMTGQFEFEERSGIMQRLSSVFPHPMTFGMYLGLSMAFFMCMPKEKRYYRYMIILAILNIFISGVRTTMAAFFVVALCYLLMIRKIKYFLYAIISISIFYIIAPILFPSLVEILNSFTASSSESGGSSWEMRITQYNGCLAEISNNPLFGKGYSWTKAYMSENRAHPVIKCFESLLFVILCNWGVLGLIFFGICFIWLFVQIRLVFTHKTECYFLYCLWIFYLSYCFITGEYGYMRYALLFYSIIYSLLSHKGLYQKKI